MPDQDERKPSPIDLVISRRRVLAGMAGVAGLVAVPSLLAACGSSSTPTPSVAASPGASPSPAASAGVSPSAAASVGPSAGGAITLASGYSDAAPKAAMKAAADAFSAATEIDVTIDTTEQGKFRDSIVAYLQGTPDDAFTWFAGYRMRSLAAQHLATDISDVWQQVGGSFSAPFKAASTGDDGKQYFLPFVSYPWAVIYRKSLWSAKGYQVPTNETGLTALMDKMKTDGLDPLAFGASDGRPAMAIFDILDMRLNGYDFHIGLLAGKEKWTDPRVKAVFTKWAGWLGKGYFQDGARGRTWQDAFQAVIDKKAGMCFLGTFAAAQATDAAVRDDLDLFAFPTLGTQYDAELAIDAPIDGFMLSSKPKYALGAKAFLEYLATGEAQIAFLAASPNDIASAKDADTSKYTAWQKRIQAVVGQAQRIGQLLDHDTRPDFTGPSGMQGFLLDFLGDPKQDLVSFLAGIQSSWDSLPPS